MMKIGQAAPQIPGQNILQAIDTINQAIYVAMTQDPIVGALAKAIPPPPKISAIFSQQVQQLQLPKLPIPLQLPFLVQPQPTQQQIPKPEEGVIF
jgi:hypothetical protein